MYKLDDTNDKQTPSATEAMDSSMDFLFENLSILWRLILAKIKCIFSHTLVLLSRSLQKKLKPMRIWLKVMGETFAKINP